MSAAAPAPGPELAKPATPVPAFVGLGGNLDDPAARIRRAFAALGGLPDTRVTATSSLYRSAPVGYLDQPHFINAVVGLETLLAPLELLDALFAIEHDAGRARSFRNAPRTLDLDLLIYGSLVLAHPRLTLPHPRMAGRAFVLAPLAEIAPQLEIPGAGKAGELAAACAGQDVERLTDRAS